MKKIATLFLLTVFSLNLFADVFLWPIKGKQAGEGIIYKPGDTIKAKLDFKIADGITINSENYFKEEINYCNLFITAPEGSVVVAPCDGIIKSTSYEFSSDLTYCHLAATYEDDLVTSVNYIDFKKGISTLKYAKNWTYSITIKYSSNKLMRISGLVPVKYFKTGHHIKKGDTIGLISYSYRKIEQPSIKISLSRNTMADDPMTPFGLISTFDTTKNIGILKNKTLSIKKLQREFNIIRKSLEEAHPGLYDYVTKQKLDSIFDDTFRKIKSPINSNGFKLLILPILNVIADSHTSIYNLDGKSEYLASPPFLYGYINNKLTVFKTIKKYKKFLNKSIKSIDGHEVKEMVKDLGILIFGNDGKIESYKKRTMLSKFWKLYNIKYDKVDGEELDIVFESDERLKIKLSKSNLDSLVDKNEQVEALTTRMINSDIAYIDINSFSINQVETDSMNYFLRKIEKLGVSNLIIDVRDNSGGRSPKDLFSCLAKENFKGEEYEKVNKAGDYICFSYSSNRAASAPLFREYKQVEGREGFYKFNNDLTTPNPSTHYSGNLYVLVNENSRSAATEFPSLVHKYNRGKIIGRESGSTFHQLNAIKYVKFVFLTSGFNFRMPLVKLINFKLEDTDIPFGRGVLPDYEIPLTIKEITSERDIVLDSAIVIVQNISKQEKLAESKSNNILYLLLFILGIGALVFTYKKSRVIKK